jgi:hypothetical protein
VLATNQEHRRADYLRRRIGAAVPLDRVIYSADVGYQAMITPDGEPVAIGWDVYSLDDLVSALWSGARRSSDNGPVIVAVDGRSGSGKSTLTERLRAHVDGSEVVHTDDVAWWESFFGWDELLVEGVLLPASRGAAVRYRPPAWDRRGRDGAIVVQAGVPMLVIEGVGASRRSLGPWLGASLWVQSDLGEARRRGVARDGGTAEAEAFWDEWADEESSCSAGGTAATAFTAVRQR